MNYYDHYIDHFKSHFQGRQDIYALRWEKEGKSGFILTYKADWNDYIEHKADGGIFKDY